MEYSFDAMIKFVAGILAGLATVFLIRFLTKKRGPCKYDERQMLARGEAYRAAFWTLVAYMGINGILFMGTGFVWADMLTGSFLGIFLALTVYAVVCIAKDAYLPLKEKPKTYFAILGAVVFVSLFMILVDEAPIVTDGMLNIRSMYAAVAISNGTLIISLAAKQIADKKHAAAE